MAKDYTSTLNLPSTSFAMRANLPQREPEMLKYWEQMDLYARMLGANAAGFKVKDKDKEILRSWW